MGWGGVGLVTIGLQCYVANLALHDTDYVSNQMAELYFFR